MTDEHRKGFIHRPMRPGAPNPGAIFRENPEFANDPYYVPATLIIHHPVKEYCGNACRVFKKNERGEVVTRARNDAEWEEVVIFDNLRRHYVHYVGMSEPANLRALADCMEDK